MNDIVNDVPMNSITAGNGITGLVMMLPCNLVRIFLSHKNDKCRKNGTMN